MANRVVRLTVAIKLSLNGTVPSMLTTGRTVYALQRTEGAKAYAVRYTDEQKTLFVDLCMFT